MNIGPDRTKIPAPSGHHAQFWALDCIAVVVVILVTIILIAVIVVCCDLGVAVFPHKFLDLQDGNSSSQPGTVRSLTNLDQGAAGDRRRRGT